MARKLHGNCDGLSRIRCNVCPGCKRLEEKEMQTSSEGNCACKTQAVKPDLVKVKEGTSGSFKPHSSLSPFLLSKLKLKVRVYHTVVSVLGVRQTHVLK